MLGTRSSVERFALAFGATVGICAIGGAAIQHGLFSSETAAWVQAVGAIAAVVGVGWSTQALIAGDTERHREELVARAIIAYQVATQMAQAIAESAKSLAPDAPVTFHEQNFESVELSLGQLELMQLPTGRIATAVINLRRAVHFYRNAYKAAVAAKTAGSSVPAAAAAEMEKWRSAVDTALSAIEADAKELGAIAS